MCFVDEDGSVWLSGEWAKKAHEGEHHYVDFGEVLIKLKLLYDNTSVSYVQDDDGSPVLQEPMGIIR